MLSAFASIEAQSTFTGKITYTIYYSYISHTGKIPRLPLNLKTFRLHREQVAQVSMGCIALLPVNDNGDTMNISIVVSMGCIALLPVNNYNEEEEQAKSFNGLHCPTPCKRSSSSSSSNDSFNGLHCPTPCKRGAGVIGAGAGFNGLHCPTPCKQ